MHPFGCKFEPFMVNFCTPRGSFDRFKFLGDVRDWGSFNRVNNATILGIMAFYTLSGDQQLTFNIRRSTIDFHYDIPSFTVSRLTPVGGIFLGPATTKKSIRVFNGFPSWRGYND